MVRRALFLLPLLFAGTTHADTREQLLRCDETSFESGVYGRHFGRLYHGTDQVCGGDPLAGGNIGVVGGRHILVNLEGSHPFNLYEVYWVPIGGDPAVDRVMVGNFLTDCEGRAHAILRDITHPVDALTAPPVDIGMRVGPLDAGQFLIYSRGPWGTGETDNCRIPATINTDDGTLRGRLVNPDLWGGSPTAFDGVQYISGYAAP